MITPREDAAPKGFRVVADGELVQEGDVVLDYIDAEGFATITKDSPYASLIGKTGHAARLDQLAFEVFTRSPVPDMPCELTCKNKGNGGMCGQCF